MLGTKKSTADVDWELFVGDRREAFGNMVVDEAIERLRRGHVQESPRFGVGVLASRAFGDNRTRSRAAFYWPRGDGTGFEPFHCRCRRFQRRGVCSHALAASMYVEWLGEQDRASRDGVR